LTDTAIAPAAPGATASDLLNSGAAPAAALSWQPAGMPVTPSAFDAPEAISARTEIDVLKADKSFYKSLLEEKERGVSGPANKKWADLHQKGWPSPTGIASQNDLNAQVVARTEEQWNSFFAGLKAQWPVTPAMEAEMRAGIVREEYRNWALEQRALLVKDRGFYRRLLDGDMAAKEKWGRVVALIGLRPVKVPS
jgi:hypothetical protein